ncbi:hypothetical protein FOA52_014541 [Chlamydomonas sp. UWO 241]|nr:hypothetical protein FOA52_014541 [Chlamydomonas sp. UWO 241]
MAQVPPLGGTVAGGSALNTGAFNIGERALVPFTDKHYEAKILKAEYREDSMWYYFVHYNGWNKKYDTWVEDAGLIKMPQDAAEVGANAGGPAGGTKRRVTMKEKFTKRPNIAGLVVPAEGSAILMELDLPPVLKQQLLDGYDAIVEEGKLIPLPRKPTIDALLQRYVADAQEHRGSSESEEELALGLRTYFDKALQVSLLYRSEREQAKEAMMDSRVASCVYGAEHLIRLFIKLPELMAVAVTNETQASNVATMVQGQFGMFQCFR